MLLSICTILSRIVTRTSNTTKKIHLPHPKKCVQNVFQKSMLMRHMSAQQGAIVKSVDTQILSCYLEKALDPFFCI